VTSGDDFDVKGPQLDDRGADALLAGAATGVPEGWGAVARRLDALRPLPASTPPDDDLLDRMQAAIGSRRRRPAATLRFRPRVAAATLAGFVAALVGFGGLAAANALPSGVQRFVSDTLDHVGISVPSPADHGGAPANGSDGSPGDHGTNATVPATGKGQHKGAGNSTSTTPAGSSAPGSSAPGSSAPGSTPGATAPRGSSATAPGTTAPRGSSATAPGQTAVPGNSGNAPGQNNAGGNSGNGSQGNGGGPPSTTGNGVTRTHPTKP
jgi:hypothetical protein